jgi:hypothetical protein
MARAFEDPETRFWRHVNKTPACWLWTGARTGGQIGGSGGRYGSFIVRVGPHKGRYAHRFSWRLHRGAIPEGLVICHTCDNPLCVNPEHMFLGTMAENNADMRAKGRQARGERHGMRKHPHRRARGERQGNARLTEADVHAIRQLYATGGITQKVLGQQFGVSREHVRDIVRGKRWTHLAPHNLRDAVALLEATP